jgi:hypothetical protein
MKVYLVELEDVYSRRAGRVQDGTQEPKDVLHPVVVAGLYQLPVHRVLLPHKRTLVLAMTFEGPLVSLCTFPVKVRQRLLCDVV